MYNSLENKELPLLTVRLYTATTAQIIPCVHLKRNSRCTLLSGRV